MSLGDTVHKWGKDLGKSIHKPANAMERHQRRAGRPARKAEERKRKMAAKMKNAGYPAKFTSAKEQETQDPDYPYKH